MSVNKQVEVQPFTIAHAKIHSIAATRRRESKGNCVPVRIDSTKITMFQLFSLCIYKAAVGPDYAAEHMLLAARSGS